MLSSLDSFAFTFSRFQLEVEAAKQINFAFMLSTHQKKFFTILSNNFIINCNYKRCFMSLDGHEAKIIFMEQSYKEAIKTVDGCCSYEKMRSCSLMKWFSRVEWRTIFSLRFLSTASRSTMILSLFPWWTYLLCRQIYCVISDRDENLHWQYLTVHITSFVFYEVLFYCLEHSGAYKRALRRS